MQTAASRIAPFAGACLYLGPLLAGLSGFGFRALPVFLAIYLLWDGTTRPESWPITRAGWTQARLQALAGRTVVLAVIVALLFAVGRGIGGAVGHIPAMPLGLPLMVSLVAVAMVRIFRDPLETRPEADNADKRP